jgi:hypothetical protein
MQNTTGESCRVERFRVLSDKIEPGVIITYKLRSDQLPVHPEKVWRGKVLLYNKLFHRAVVESLEEGYEECEDDVWLEQIVQIEERGYTAPSQDEGTLT